MSSRDMTLTEIKHTTKSFDDSHTVKVKDLKTGGGTKKPRNNQIPKWFKDFYDKDYKPFQQAFIESQSKPPKYFLEFQAQMLDLFKETITRIDKLENLVVIKFKQHKWIKC